MEEKSTVLFGLKLKKVQDDGNTDSCSECVFNHKCPIFNGKSICQNEAGEFNSHFVEVTE